MSSPSLKWNNNDSSRIVASIIMRSGNDQAEQQPWQLALSCSAGLFSSIQFPVDIAATRFVD